ncbi:unnamed protein product [Notodromas monacha]|uniref:Uncharacterized protein n=1 Tax=Notodromas monacha TaxID=399045 RepID=A0A7R9GC71_9CRUS|nr:unnamed protein product [Notodromas monacha]CAG0917314.1 unnamed protein product [Notodromas monacha]
MAHTIGPPTPETLFLIESESGSKSYTLVTESSDSSMSPEAGHWRNFDRESFMADERIANLMNPQLDINGDTCCDQHRSGAGACDNLPRKKFLRKQSRPCFECDIFLALQGCQRTAYYKELKPNPIRPKPETLKLYRMRDKYAAAPHFPCDSLKPIDPGCCLVYSNDDIPSNCLVTNHPQCSRKHHMILKTRRTRNGRKVGVDVLRFQHVMQHMCNVESPTNMATPQDTSTGHSIPVITDETWEYTDQNRYYRQQLINSSGIARKAGAGDPSSTSEATQQSAPTESSTSSELSTVKYYWFDDSIDLRARGLRRVAMLRFKNYCGPESALHSYSRNKNIILQTLCSQYNLEKGGVIDDEKTSTSEPTHLDQQQASTCLNCHNVLQSLTSQPMQSSYRQTQHQSITPLQHHFIQVPISAKNTSSFARESSTPITGSRKSSRKNIVHELTRKFEGINNQIAVDGRLEQIAMRPFSNITDRSARLDNISNPAQVTKVSKIIQYPSEERESGLIHASTKTSTEPPRLTDISNTPFNAEETGQTQIGEHLSYLGSTSASPENVGLDDGHASQILPGDLVKNQFSSQPDDNYAKPSSSRKRSSSARRSSKWKTPVNETEIKAKDAAFAENPRETSLACVCTDEMGTVLATPTLRLDVLSVISDSSQAEDSEKTKFPDKEAENEESSPSTPQRSPTKKQHQEQQVSSQQRTVTSISHPTSQTSPDYPASENVGQVDISVNSKRSKGSISQYLGMENLEMLDGDDPTPTHITDLASTTVKGSSFRQSSDLTKRASSHLGNAELVWANENGIVSPGSGIISDAPTRMSDKAGRPSGGNQRPSEPSTIRQVSIERQTPRRTRVSFEDEAPPLSTTDAVNTSDINTLTKTPGTQQIRDTFDYQTNLKVIADDTMHDFTETNVKLQPDAFTYHHGHPDASLRQTGNLSRKSSRRSRKSSGSPQAEAIKPRKIKGIKLTAVLEEPGLEKESDHVSSLYTRQSTRNFSVRGSTAPPQRESQNSDQLEPNKTETIVFHRPTSDIEFVESYSPGTHMLKRGSMEFFGEKSYINTRPRFDDLDGTILRVQTADGKLRDLAATLPVDNGRRLLHLPAQVQIRSENRNSVLVLVPKRDVPKEVETVLKKWVTHEKRQRNSTERHSSRLHHPIEKQRSGSEEIDPHVQQRLDDQHGHEKAKKLRLRFWKSQKQQAENTKNTKLAELRRYGSGSSFQPSRDDLIYSYTSTEMFDEIKSNQSLSLDHDPPAQGQTIKRLSTGGMNDVHELYTRNATRNKGILTNGVNGQNSSHPRKDNEMNRRSNSRVRISDHLEIIKIDSPREEVFKQRNPFLEIRHRNQSRRHQSHQDPIHASDSSGSESESESTDEDVSQNRRKSYDRGTRFGIQSKLPLKNYKYSDEDVCSSPTVLKSCPSSDSDFKTTRFSLPHNVNTSTPGGNLKKYLSNPETRFKALESCINIKNETFRDSEYKNSCVESKTTSATHLPDCPTGCVRNSKFLQDDQMRRRNGEGNISRTFQIPVNRGISSIPPTTTHHNSNIKFNTEKWERPPEHSQSESRRFHTSQTKVGNPQFRSLKEILEEANIPRNRQIPEGDQHVSLINNIPFDQYVPTPDHQQRVEEIKSIILAKAKGQTELTNKKLGQRQLQSKGREKNQSIGMRFIETLRATLSRDNVKKRKKHSKTKISNRNIRSKDSFKISRSNIPMVAAYDPRTPQISPAFTETWTQQIIPNHTKSTIPARNTGTIRRPGGQEQTSSQDTTSGSSSDSIQ